MIDWTQKHVVILGASQGLGFELAAAWHARGAHVTLAARDESRLATAKKELKANQSTTVSEQGDDDRIKTISADVTNSDDVGRLFQQIGQIDVLVNAFGRSDRGLAVETTTAKYQELMELNFLAVTRCVRAAYPALLRSKGSIVNIGSLASKTVSRFLGAYPASKFALAAYSAQLRMELAEQGIHVLLVCPGPIGRDDAGQRYNKDSIGLPESARQPGGGVKVRAIDPQWLANQIIDSCESRKAELIVPAKSRIVFVLAQLSPRLGDWIVRKMTS